MYLKVIITTQDGATRDVLVDERSAQIVGRESDVQLRFPDSLLSGRHCRLSLKHQQLYFEDLNSRNGTRLNGELKSEGTVSGADVLSVGSLRITVSDTNHTLVKGLDGSTAWRNVPKNRLPQEELLLRLSRVHLIDKLAPETHETIVDSCPLLELTMGQTLCEQGDKSDALYILLSGSLRVLMSSLGAEPVTVGRVHAPNLVGEMQLLSATDRSASLVAECHCQILSIERTFALSLLSNTPNLIEQFASTVRDRTRHNQLVSILPRISSSIEPSLIADLEREGVWRTLKRGACLYAEGERTSSMFIVITGRLRLTKDMSSGPRKYAEVSAGECIGETAVLDDSKRTETATAIRCTELLEINTESFRRMAANHPAWLIGISRQLAGRVQRVNSHRKNDEQEIKAIAIIPSGSIDLTESFALRLAESLGKVGATHHLSPDVLAGKLGGASQARLPRDDPQFIRLSSLLDGIEDAAQFVVYQCESAESEWTRRCIERAELVILIGASYADPAPSQVEELLEQMDEHDGVTAQRYLVLYHPEETHLPSGTNQWLDKRNVDLHLHCRHGYKPHFDRVARFISGRALGLVLGGGGARGLAHIGVVKALQEQNIPIDMIGGTSAGAMIGAALAEGIDMDTMIEKARRVFLDIRPFSAYTLPFLSLIDRKRMDRGAKFVFGDIQIEDLWIPFFCLSCNLTRGASRAHRRGSLWRAIRATTSLPGIAVPMIEDGELYVDGGVIENVPVQTMCGFKGGPNIVVDVSPTDELGVDCTYEDLPSGWGILWQKLNPFHKKRPLFSITQVLSRVASISSVSQRDMIRDLSDVIIEPPVGEYGLLEFSAIDALVEIAYQDTLRQLHTSDTLKSIIPIKDPSDMPTMVSESTRNG
jgi:predicted acylesterase/phospholipase RssA/CRP-like cAMP-binding protein